MRIRYGDFVVCANSYTMNAFCYTITVKSYQNLLSTFSTCCLFNDTYLVDHDQTNSSFFQHNFRNIFFYSCRSEINENPNETKSTSPKKERAASSPKKERTTSSPTKESGGHNNNNNWWGSWINTAKSKVILIVH